MSASVESERRKNVWVLISICVTLCEWKLTGISQSNAKINKSACRTHICFYTIRLSMILSEYYSRVSAARTWCERNHGNCDSFKATDFLEHFFHQIVECASRVWIGKKSVHRQQKVLKTGKKDTAASQLEIMNFLRSQMLLIWLLYLVRSQCSFPIQIVICEMCVS